MNTDDYEGHTPGPWIDVGVDTLTCPVCFRDYHGGLTEIQRKVGFEENFIHDHADSIAVILCEDNGQTIRHPAAVANSKLITAAPDLLAEVERLRYWIYHHAKNLDAGGVHTFADEAREVIGLVKGEVRDYEHR